MRRTLPLFFALTVGAAQASTGVIINKPSAEYTLEAGQSFTGSVQVISPVTEVGQNMLVEVRADDFLLKLDGDAVYSRAGSHLRSATRWLNLEASSFNLPPQGAREVRYTVQVPAGTPAGGYWGVLFFKGVTPPPPVTKSAAEGFKANIIYNIEIGHVIYVRVGNPVVRGEITALKASLKEGKPNVAFTVKNTGNIFWRTAGSVSIVDLKTGQAVAKQALLGKLVLPGTPDPQDATRSNGYSRSLELDFANALPTGDYRVILSLELERGRSVEDQTDLKVE